MGIFSTLGHFFFGGPAKSKNSTQSTTTAQTSPYGPAVGPINDYLSSTQDLYKNTPLISNYEQTGLDALNGAVSSSQQDLSAAKGLNNDTLSGKYLTPDTNPYLADIARRVGGGAMATINDTFGGKGRTGSGLHQEFAGEGVGNALTDFYGSEYDKERQLQQDAIGNASQLTAASILGPQALVTAGQNVSARPFDVNAQYGSILNNIAKLGTSGTTTGDTTGKSTGTSESNGWLLNKLFPS